MNTAYDEKMARMFFRQIVEGLILEGVIDPKGKTGAELRKEIIAWLEKNIALNPNVSFWTVTDHTPTILQQARSLLKNESLELSCLFYATWFEHWLNHLIAIAGRRR